MNDKHDNRETLQGTQDWVYSQGQLDSSHPCALCGFRQALKRFRHILNGEWICWRCADAINAVSQHDSHDAENVMKAIKGAEYFMALIAASMHAVEESTQKGALSKGQAMSMLVTLMLMCGWKLAERAMESLAERVAS